MRILVVLAAVLVPTAAHAHAFNPSLLELKAVGPEEWQLGWRNQVGTLRLPCDNLTHCRLEGKTLSIDGLGDRDVLVRVQFFDGRTSTAVLRRDAPSLTVRETPEAPAYIQLGTTHILGGFDHLLFVLGLLLLVERRKLLLTLTAFTLAHSLTLALAMLDVVRVPQAPVEAAIALSILFVAVELVRERRRGPGHPPATRLTERRPWLIAFAFGLLHGLGFAGALGEIGLPAGQVAQALVCFNVGVELGQLAFVAALLFAAELLPISRVPRRVPAYAIGALAAFFCLDRIGSFWS
jgi:hypothetical protein